MENSKAIEHFKATDSHLEGKNGLDSKQSYEKKLKEEGKRRNAEVQVLAIPWDTWRRPPNCLEQDSKLISLLESIRSR